jgi:hypothetical protein
MSFVPMHRMQEILTSVIFTPDNPAVRQQQQQQQQHSLLSQASWGRLEILSQHNPAVRQPDLFGTLLG